MGDKFIEDIIQQLKQGHADESISIRFEDSSRDEVHKQTSNTASRRTGKQIRVTDLVNPMQWFYEVSGTPIDDPPELRKKFDYGNAMERKVTSILSDESGFIHLAEQGRTSGSNCGMDRVKGRIDFRIGNSIIEFKTADDKIADVESLLRNHPHNLEQLLLYVLFSGRERYEHKLLFLTGQYPNLIPVEFKVKITDRQKLVEYFAKRLEKMSLAVENKNPSGLGKCRYHGSLCKFDKSKVCDCENESEIDIDPIRESIRVQLIKGDLDSKLSNPNIAEAHYIGIWDLFSPRQWIVRESNPLELSGYEDSDKLQLYNLRKRIESRLVEDKVITRNEFADPDIEISEHYYSFSTSNAREGSEKDMLDTPVLIRITDRDSKEMKGKINKVYAAQVGVISSLLDKNVGYIFIYYIKSDNGILIEIRVNNPKKIKERIREIIEDMKKSLVTRTVSENLPTCPTFIYRNCTSINCLCKAHIESGGERR